MAVKIVRQPKTIALIGAPTSAAGHRAGHERAPAALRAAGLVEQLTAAGYEVIDMGDCPQHTYQTDDEHPRARNTGPTLAALNALKPMVEHAVKGGALPLILGGDCTIALATVAGVRRYYPGVSLVYCDSDADLNVPATSPSGVLDGMVVAHLTGRGAPELVRFWGEPPLVREPVIALFGVKRLDPPEQAFLEKSPIRHYSAAAVQRQGAAAAAEAALARIHTGTRQFVLHFDVDVIAAEDFQATNFPGAGGLRLEEVRQALEVFARQPNLAAFEVTVYNPERDPDSSGARLLVDLLASVLAARLAALTAPLVPSVAREAAPATAPAEPAPSSAPDAAVVASTEETPATPAAPAAAILVPSDVEGSVTPASESPSEGEPALATSTDATEPPNPDTPPESKQSAS